VTVVFAFLFVDLFDNTGTLIALAHRGGFMRPDGTVPRLHRALMADSGAAMIGAAVGTSTTTSYIESASGINAGGRTGLTAATVGVLFLLALFVAPLAGSIPAYATAPALFYVACLMVRSLTEVEWGRHHRGRTRRRHGDHDALHLLDRRRHRVRLHLVRRDQGRDRALP
jgi:AGZA family xanthine/uracil permease-like MFS transporter